MMENNWRVRRTAINMITELAQGFKAIELFEVHLQEFFFQYLNDPVHAIRLYGNEQLPVQHYIIFSTLISFRKSLRLKAPTGL
jgi:hypothetical protein